MGDDDPAMPPTGGNPRFARAYGLDGPDAARALYDDWAATYDADLADPSQDYVAPALAADAVIEHAGTGAVVLDAGCGTGLVGVALVERGIDVVDGLDLSPVMLERARASGVYRGLGVADLTVPLAVADRAYDAVVCVGTFTHGHVGPGALTEFVRVLTSGGHVVATVIEDLWEPGGFRAEIDRLAATGLAVPVSTDVVPYRAGAGVRARMLVLRVR